MRSSRALAGLTKVGSSEDPATLAVYRMQNADERAVFQLLQNPPSNAKLTLDYRTDSIMALAVAEDHQVIKNALDQLDPGAWASTRRSCGSTARQRRRRA